METSDPAAGGDVDVTSGPAAEGGGDELRLGRRIGPGSEAPCEVRALGWARGAGDMIGWVIQEEWIASWFGRKQASFLRSNSRCWGSY